jgi:hypothetical protein
MFKSTYSSIPSRYTYHLQARCDSGALLRNAERIQTYNLPNWYSFGNISPSINNNGNVAFKVLGLWHQAIWYGTARTGCLVYTGPRGALLSKVSLNNQDCLVWEQLRSRDNGIWHYDAVTNTSTQLTTAPMGSCGWASATVNDRGSVGFRAKFADAYGFACYSPTLSPATSTLALMSNLDASSIYSFLFLPSFNNNGQIAAKVRLGQPGDIGDERPDQIRIFDPDGDSKLIVANRNYDTDSPYQSFDNSIGFNDNGQIAFIATLSSGQRGVFRFDGVGTNAIAHGMSAKLIAIEGDGQISRIERFPPKLNNNGLTVFRAFDAEGLRAIWAGDGVTLHKVVTEGDILPTDIGMLRLARPDDGAVFSGLPDLNDQGDIVFAASLSDPEEARIGFGAGLFIARIAAIEPVDSATNAMWYSRERN